MIDLQQGDCLKLMKDIPDNSVDLILTDPPYNISRDNNFETMGRKGIQFGDWDHNFNQVSWLTGVNRIMKAGSSIVIFNAWRNLGTLDEKLDNEGFVGKDVFRWIKTNPMPRNRDRRYITDYEFALIATNKKGKWVFNRYDSKYERPMYSCSVVTGSKRFHPTQKPISLMEYLVCRHSNPGQTILDPFMGSGSTGIACVNTNRNFIGMELDCDYFKIAEQRINEAGKKAVKEDAPRTNR